jgi:hypothetical protein
MTVRASVAVADWNGTGQPGAWLSVESGTIAQAVRRAAAQLGLAPGHTIGKPRWLDSHTREWDWSGTLLLVRQSRSGARSADPANGDQPRPVVSIRLSDDELSQLDEIAEARSLSRGATVAALVSEARALAVNAALATPACESEVK